MEWLDGDICYRAMETRDPRFDGLLYTGVMSTGIYCRPICPARTPKRANCVFFQTAAAAQEAGFRACLRCRPELSPEVACWRGTSNTVSRAMALIAEGFLDDEAASVESLAERVGVGERQLRRLFERHLGASPVSVAQTRRVLFAKQLIHDTQLSMTQVALAAGFGSIRRFNDAFRALYQRPPSELRRSKRGAASPDAPLELQMSYRPPYDWQSMLGFFEARAIEGVELVDGGRYRRVVSHGGQLGTVEVRHEPARRALVAKIQFPCVRAIPVIVSRLRTVFDVNADIGRIGEHLARDPSLAALIAERPGLHSPGGWSGFELAVRAILGQQISVAGARQLAAKLVRLCSRPWTGAADNGLTHAFPTAAEVTAADLSTLGMPASRRSAVKALAQAAVEQPRLFEPVGSVEEIVTKLRSIQGVGEWTAQYIALRALRETDAFPASDVGLLRGAAKMRRTPVSVEQLLAHAEAWRPWRAYAAQHLWAADAARVL